MTALQAKGPRVSMPGFDILKHIFAFAVIVQHMVSSRYSAETTDWLKQYVSWADARVAGFCLLSGYFLRSSMPWKSFLIGRAKRLLVPFLIFSFIYAFALSALGKGDILVLLMRTVLFVGSSMQLYFLPYLFLGGALLYWMHSVQRLRHGTVMSVCVLLILLLLSLWFPTLACGGRDYRLLPFYGLAMLLGIFFHRWDGSQQVRLVVFAGLTCLAVGVIDARFIKLAAVCGLFLIALWANGILPPVRLPGSGGVFLLHTPILNYALSIGLVHLGVVQKENIVASLVLTYILCHCCPKRFQAQ